MHTLANHCLNRSIRFNWLGFLILFCQSCATPDLTPKPKEKIYCGLSFVGSPEMPTINDIHAVVQTGANAISLMPFAFLNSDEKSITLPDSATLWAGESTLGISKAIELAQSREIDCMIKPQLWIDEGTFAGYFQAADSADWRAYEEDYTRFILHFAVMSQTHHLPLFCIGTELDAWASARPKYWLSLIQKIREVYHGQLVYACNCDGTQKIPFWDKLDLIGIDAYHPLSNSAEPSVEELLIAWERINPQFKNLSEQYEKKILFTEWGYQAVVYPTKEPWIESASIATNEKAQANCYQALWQHCLKQDWFCGGFVWKWFPPEGSETSQAFERFSPQNRQASEVLSRIYHENK
jgi:hypothetical protein